MLNDQDENENTLDQLSFFDGIRRRYDLTPSILLILAFITLFFLIFLIYPLLYVFKEAFWIDGKFNLTFFKLMAN